MFLFFVDLRFVYFLGTFRNCLEVFWNFLDFVVFCWIFFVFLLWNFGFLFSELFSNLLLEVLELLDFVFNCF